jgi:hypothetical protein
MRSRWIRRASVAVVCPMILLAGCADRQRPAVEQTATAFLAAVGAGDTRAGCALLAPRRAICWSTGTRRRASRRSPTCRCRPAASSTRPSGAEPPRCTRRRTRRSSPEPARAGGSPRPAASSAAMPPTPARSRDHEGRLLCAVYSLLIGLGLAYVIALGCCTGETVSQGQRTRPGLRPRVPAHPGRAGPRRARELQRSAGQLRRRTSISRRVPSSFGVDVARIRSAGATTSARPSSGTARCRTGNPNSSPWDPSPCSQSSCGSADHPSRNGSATSTPSSPTAVEIGRRKLQPSGEAHHG